MSPEINPVVFQKNWPSTSGFGGAERATMRFTEAISQSEQIAILTCGEYYRGKEKSVDYQPPDHIFSENKLTIHEIPSVSQIVDLVLKNRSEVGVFQIGWGFEHYPDDFSRILDTNLPLVLRICETEQYKQLVQELPEVQKKGFLEKMVSRVDSLVAISTPLVNEAVETGFDPKRVHLIYSSVDTDIFKPVSSEDKKITRGMLKLPKEERIFLFVGRAVQAKGIDTLIGAWNKLPEDFKDKNHMVIVGASTQNDPAYDLFKSTVSSGDRSMSFPGVITDEKEVAKYYQASDVFLYPSLHNEGLSVSILEAMSSGLPVITTEWIATKTGAKDLVKPDKTGIVFDQNSGQEGLSKVIANIDWDHVSSLGKMARKHVLSLGVDNKIAAEKYINLYTELLSSGINK